MGSDDALRAVICLQRAARELAANRPEVAASLLANMPATVPAAAHTLAYRLLARAAESASFARIDTNALARDASARSDPDPVRGLAFVDGDCLATVSKAQGLSLWNPATGARLFSSGPGPNWSIAAADGWIATGSADDTVQLFQVTIERDRAVLRHTLPRHEGGVRALAFSPDGALLAVACGGGDWEFSPPPSRIVIWHVANGTHSRTIACKETSMPPKSLAFSPDGQQLLVGIGWPTRGFLRGEVEIHDVSRGEHVRTLHALGCSITDVAYFRDGRRIAVLGHGLGLMIPTWSMCVLNVETGERLLCIERLGERSGNAFALAPDDWSIAVLGDDRMSIVDLIEGRVREELIIPKGTSAVTFAPASAATPSTARMVTSGEDGFVRHWQHGGLSARTVLEVGGQPLLVGQADTLFLARKREDGTSHVLRVTLPAAALTATIEASWPLGDKPTALALSADGRWLAVALDSYEDSLLVLDAASGSVRLRMRFGYDRLSDLSFSSDGRLVTSDGRALQVWQSADGWASAASVLRIDDAYARDLAWSLDGRRIGVGKNIGAFVVYGVPEGLLSSQPISEPERVMCVAGQWLVSTRGGPPAWVGSIERFDASMRNLGAMFGLRGGTQALAASPDGRTLVSLQHSVLQVWDLDAGEEAYCLLLPAGAAGAALVARDDGLVVACSDGRIMCFSASD